MEEKDFKELIEQPLRVNDRRIVDANTCVESEFYRSNNVTLRATISKTIRLCLSYHEQAKQYYEGLPKATQDANNKDA